MSDMPLIHIIRPIRSNVVGAAFKIIEAERVQGEMTDREREALVGSNTFWLNQRDAVMDLVEKLRDRENSSRLAS